MERPYKPLQMNDIPRDYVFLIGCSSLGTQAHVSSRFFSPTLFWLYQAPRSCSACSAFDTTRRIARYVRLMVRSGFTLF